MVQALQKNRTRTQLLRMRKADPLTKWILHKIYVDRENCIIKILGKVQRGKSTVAKEISWRALPYLFTMKNVVWRPEQFAEQYTSGVKRGDPMMYEEIGTEAGGLPRRRWYEFNNLLIMDIMQTHGFEGGICILTLPSSKYLDSNLDPLIDIVIEVKKIDRDKQTNIFTAYWVEYGEGEVGKPGKIYRHSFLDENGEKVEAFAWKRTFPHELLLQYKEAEKEFKHWIQTRVFEEVRRKKITSDQEEEMTREILKEINQYLIKIRGGKTIISCKLIEDRFKIGFRISERIKYKAEREILTNPQYNILRTLISSKLVLAEGQKNDLRDKTT